MGCAGFLLCVSMGHRGWGLGLLSAGSVLSWKIICLIVLFLVLVFSFSIFYLLFLGVVFSREVALVLPISLNTLLFLVPADRL